MQTLSWKNFITFGVLGLLLLAPRFGHAGDPESKTLLAATHVPSTQPRLAIHLSHENDSPLAAEWLEPFTGRLDTHGVVEVVLPGEKEAAAYAVELGLRREGTGDGAQLRIRVLSRDEQVLLAFRAPLGEGQKAFDESARRLASWFEEREWRSTVLSLDEERRITIYGGSRHQLSPGLQLSAVAHQPVYDDAGLPLGQASTPIGRLRLVEVDERTAVAEIVSGCEQIAPGTEVILAHTAP